MSDDPRIVYWDANVFLAYFQAEPDRIDLLTQFLEKVVKDEGRKIFTSTLSITEVAFIGSERSGLDPNVEVTIDAFWNDHRIVEFVEVHEGITRSARSLMRQCIDRGIKVLKAADAIHIASAMALDVEEINTYDLETWAKYEDMIGIEIREPHLNQSKLI